MGSTFWNICNLSFLFVLARLYILFRHLSLTRNLFPYFGQLNHVQTLLYQIYSTHVLPKLISRILTSLYPFYSTSKISLFFSSVLLPLLQLKYLRSHLANLLNLFIVPSRFVVKNTEDCYPFIIFCSNLRKKKCIWLIYMLYLFIIFHFNLSQLQYNLLSNSPLYNFGLNFIL